MLSRYALKQYIWNLFVNGFLMSYIVPPTIRRSLLNVLGCEMGGGNSWTLYSAIYEVENGHS